jgi:biopolymer transport protein ExbB/TolQ
MSPLLELIRKGGPAIVAIVALSVVLYARCFKLLFSLRRMGVRPPPGQTATALPASEARRMQQEIGDLFQQQRIALGAMIAAAPLLGLLGTVSGMVKTFDILAGKVADKSMEGLARGISEVLVATESGLLVALPALLLVWLAHREMQKRVRQLNLIKRDEREEYL